MKVSSMTTCKRLSEKTDAQAADPALIPDDRLPLERERAERADAVRLRLLWIAAGGGRTGLLASCAIAAIRRAEESREPMTDRQVSGLFRRICGENGLSPHGRPYYSAFASLREQVLRPLE